MAELTFAAGTPCEPLLAERRLNPLGPGEPNRAARLTLAALTPESLAPGRPLLDRQQAQGLIAGLWLHHNFLDESHTVSQELPDRVGAFWHGIMHRREPDSGNAKYWFRRVGAHPIFPELAQAAAGAARSAQATGAGWDPAAEFLLAGDRWDAMAWIDLCDAARRGRNPCAELCIEVQLHEWALLFAHGWRQALAT